MLSNFSMTSPNTVPWAQPEVSVFFLSLSSKSVWRLVRTTTTSSSASWSMAVISSSGRSMFWFRR
jgi:hypothetical protein